MVSSTVKKVNANESLFWVDVWLGVNCSETVSGFSPFARILISAFSPPNM